MALNPEIFDIVLTNCTSLQEMTQFDRVSTIGTQSIVIIPILIGWLLLGLSLFLFGVFTSIGQSKKMLLTNENYFVVFIFWLIFGGLAIFLLWKPYYILPFI